MIRGTKYIVVGIIANLVGLLAFQACIWLSAPPEMATIAAFFPAFLCAYLLNRYWAFSSRVPISETLGLYFLATVAVILFQVGIVSVSVRVLGVVPVVAQFIALLIATPLSYLLLSRWVFGPEERLGK